MLTIVDYVKADNDTVWSIPYNISHVFLVLEYWKWWTIKTKPTTRFFGTIAAPDGKENLWNLST